MASLGLGWVGEPFVAALLEPLFQSMGLSSSATHTTAFILGFLIFSSLHITIGEQVPKTFAIRKAEPVALWCALPLRLFYLAFYPLNVVLNAISRGILSLFGVKEATHADIYSSEEIKDIVSLSAEHGTIEKDKGEMLNNLFKFHQLRVGRVMVPFGLVKSLDVAATADHNIELIKSSGHSRFPLIDSSKNDELLGLILAKDLYNCLLSGATNEEIWGELKGHVRKTLIVTEHQNVAGLFEQMRANRSHLAVVVDEYGTSVGIITFEDLLEEIVGDIEDETDTVQISTEIESIDQNTWHADGLISLADLEKQTGLAVDPSLDVNSLSGLMMKRLQKIAQQGDTVNENGFLLTAIKVNNRHVITVKIENLNADNEASLENNVPTTD